jgi:hypothetical protein
MQQNIKLDSNSQKQLLKVLHKEHINKILYSSKKIDTYDFINIDML